MADYNDHRVYDLAEPIAWGVVTDRFLTQWCREIKRIARGQSSQVAYPLYSRDDMDAFDKYAATRSDFMRPRVNRNLPRQGQVSMYDRPWGTVQPLPYEAEETVTTRTGHELEYDTVGFGMRPRVTCLVCGSTLVAQPWMDSKVWNDKLAAFEAEHGGEA